MFIRRSIVAAALLAACRPSDRPAPPASSAAARATPTPPPSADAQYAPALLIERYRRQLTDHPTTLGGGMTSADTVLARYARGVERGDTSALHALALTPGEYAWLYYLDSPMAQKPYELDPDAMWAQISSQSARGLSRAMQRLGGHSLGRWSSRCRPPRASGALRLYDCTLVTHPAGAAADVPLRLTVVERDGRFKLVGFGTSL